MEKFGNRQRPKKSEHASPSQPQRIETGSRLESTSAGETIAVDKRTPISEPSRRQERPYFHQPVYWQLIADALTEEEYTATSRIVTIGTVTVTIDNLLDAIHGRDFFPVLTTAEIMDIAESEGAERHGQWESYRLQHSETLSHIKRSIELARRKKYDAIRQKIAESTIDYENLHLPNRDAIMLALSNNEMRHIADVTEFLGKIVQLTESDVEAARHAQQELMTTDTLASRQIDSLSARTMRERWNRVEIREFAEILGLNEFDLYDIPEAVLERAINRHKLNADDITQLRHAGASANTINQLPVVVESAVFVGGALTTVGAFGASLVATSALGVSVLSPVVQTLLTVSLSGIGVTIGAGLLSRFANEPLTRIARNLVNKRRIKKYEASLQAQFTALQEKVSALQTSGVGNLQVRLMEEMMKLHTGSGKEQTNKNIELLKQWIRYFQSNPAETQRFEEVCMSRNARDFHGKDMWQVITDYKHKLAADKEVE